MALAQKWRTGTVLGDQRGEIPAASAGMTEVETRLSVQLILELLADGWSTEEILDQYPTLTRDGVLACLRYAS